MKKTWAMAVLLLLLAVFVSCGTSETQETESTETENGYEEIVDRLFENELLAVCTNERWGYIDRTGEFVILPQFEEADFRFNKKGTALVKHNGLWGWIDKEGQYTSEARYEKKPGFIEDICCYLCMEDGTAQYVNHLGLPVIEGTYDSVIYDFEKQVFTVKKDDLYGLIATDGTILLEAVYEEIAFPLRDNANVIKVKQNGKFGVLTLDGSWKYEPQFDHLKEASVLGHLTFVNETTVGDKTQYTCGIIDPNGKMLLSGLEGTNVSPFLGKYYLLSAPHPEGYDCPWYYIIDENGDRVLEEGFGHIESSGELLSVSVDGKYGYMNKSLEYVVEPQFEETSTFRNGYACVKVGGKWGMIDTQGNYFLEPKYDGIKVDDSGASSYPYIALTLDNQVSVIDLEGNTLLSPISDVKVLEIGANGILSVRIGSQFGILNTDGKMLTELADKPRIIMSIISERACAFTSKAGNVLSDGSGRVRLFEAIQTNHVSHTVCVKQNGKFGLLDDMGEEILPCAYDEINSSYYENRFITKNGSTYRIFDLGTGEFLPGEYDSAPFTSESRFILAQTQSQYTLIDQDNTVFTFALRGDRHVLLDENGELLYDFPGQISPDEIYQIYD